MDSRLTRQFSGRIPLYQLFSIWATSLPPCATTTRISISIPHVRMRLSTSSELPWMAILHRDVPELPMRDTLLLPVHVLSVGDGTSSSRRTAIGGSWQGPRADRFFISQWRNKIDTRLAKHWSAVWMILSSAFICPTPLILCPVRAQRNSGLILHHHEIAKIRNDIHPPALGSTPRYKSNWQFDDTRVWELST